MLFLQRRKCKKCSKLTNIVACYSWMRRVSFKVECFMCFCSDVFKCIFIWGRIKPPWWTGVASGRCYCTPTTYVTFIHQALYDLFTQHCSVISYLLHLFHTISSLLSVLPVWMLRFNVAAMLKWVQMSWYCFHILMPCCAVCHSLAAVRVKNTMRPAERKPDTVD